LYLFTYFELIKLFVSERNGISIFKWNPSGINTFWSINRYLNVYFFTKYWCWWKKYLTNGFPTIFTIKVISNINFVKNVDNTFCSTCTLQSYNDINYNMTVLFVISTTYNFLMIYIYIYVYLFFNPGFLHGRIRFII